MCNINRNGSSSGGVSSMVSKVGSSCPANSTQSGTSCTCNTGFNEENGQCVQGINATKACQISMVNDAFANWGNGSQVTLNGSVSSGQYCYPIDESIRPNTACAMDFELDVGWKADDGSQYSRGILRYSMTAGAPQPCVPGAGDEIGGDVKKELPKEKDKSCPNGYQGTVGGQTACIPSYGYNGVDFGVKTVTKTNDKEIVETTTGVKCESGKCTTTTTTKTTDKATGQTTTTSESRTEVDRDWCSKPANKDKCADNGKPPYSGQQTGGTTVGGGTGGNGSGGNGDGEDKGGGCGGKDQPPCKIDEKGTPESKGMLDSAEDQQAQAHKERMDTLGKIQQKGDKDTSVGFDGFSWLTHKACSPWALGTMQINGRSFELKVDICAIEPYITAVMNFLWVLGTIFMTLAMVLRVTTGTSE